MPRELRRDKPDKVLLKKLAREALDQTSVDDKITDAASSYWDKVKDRFGQSPIPEEVRKAAFSAWGEESKGF